MKALQSTEERMLVLVLISIVVLFVCCTTPAAVLSVLYSVKLDDHLGFQVTSCEAFTMPLSTGILFSSSTVRGPS